MKILRLPFCVFLFMFVYAMEDWLRSSFLSGVVGTSRPPLQLCNFFEYAFMASDSWLWLKSYARGGKHSRDDCNLWDGFFKLLIVTKTM